MSIETIVNQALDAIGYKRHVGSVWDGSPAARIALDIWAETRDEALAVRPWEFARNPYTLVDAGLSATQPWQFVFLRPVSAITVLDVAPFGVDPNDPHPGRFLEITTNVRLILTEFAPAEAVITARITDTSLWSPEFTSVVIQGLATKMQHALVGSAPKEGGDEGSGRRK